MNTKIQDMIKAAETEINSAENIHDLMQVKSRHLGKKSAISSLMSEMGKLDKSERPAFGKMVNDAKKAVEEILKKRETFIKENEYELSLVKDSIDITMPGRRQMTGALHPITQAFRLVENVLIEMGFEVAEGFDVEDEYHNFDALNTPQDHPARDLSDTFYITEKTLLRTQTSTVQIRVMEKFAPPIYIISPGRCYRNDNDASHSPAFHQIEALVIDEGISFIDLRDFLNIFVKKLFGNNIESRIRPHFFPFTEPSAEIDMQCVKCGGKGCNVCKNSGWLELGGTGMVDPNVLEAVGIDSEKYTGYAFGLGVDRIAMLLNKIPDMRLLFENDIRMLRQFR